MFKLRVSVRNYQILSFIRVVSLHIHFGSGAARIWNVFRIPIWIRILLIVSDPTGSGSTTLVIEDQAFSPSCDPLVLIHSPTFSPCRHQARLATHRKSEKERQLADGRGGKGWENNYDESTVYMVWFVFRVKTLSWQFYFECVKRLAAVLLKFVSN